MKSVAELAAERRLASTAAKPAAVAIGESNSRKSSDTVAGCPRLQLTRSEYEIARANEREREMAQQTRNTLDRVKAWQLHIESTRGRAPHYVTSSASAARVASPTVVDHVVSGPETGAVHDNSAKVVTSRSMASHAIEPIMQKDKSAGKPGAGVADEGVALAIYFDDETRLQCQFPAAARALRRNLTADLAAMLRVPEKRFTLVQLHEGPVAEVTVELGETGNQRQKEHESWTCLEIAQSLCSMVALQHGREKSKYLKSISAVKVRGIASAVRPLSVMLRPLEEVIQERLASIEYSSAGIAQSKTNGRELIDDVVNSSLQNEDILEISSDDDGAESLTYTASGFTLRDDELNEEHRSLADSSLRSEPSSVTNSGDGGPHCPLVWNQNASSLYLNRHTNIQEQTSRLLFSGFDTASCNLGVTSPPNALAISESSPANFFLEIVQAVGLPQAENAGIFPDTYACASLLYADEFRSSVFPVDHCTGDDKQESNCDMGMVQDVKNLPFKIMPHVRTHNFSRSVNPAWNARFSFAATRPSFVVLDGPNESKRLFSSQRDVSLRGQNVVLLVTIHEHQRFGAHPHVGFVVLELKPGPCVDDWFTLHRRDGKPLQSSTGPGFAQLQLRISYAASLDAASECQPQSPFNSIRASPLIRTNPRPFCVPDGFGGIDVSFSSTDCPLGGSFMGPAGAHESQEHQQASCRIQESTDKVNHLEQVAWQMMKGHHAHNSKSPTNHSLSNGLRPETAYADRMAGVSLLLQDSSIAFSKIPWREWSAGAGLHLDIVSCSNLPERLTQGQEVSPFVCASLILLNSREKEIIKQIRHDAQSRGRNTPSDETGSKHIRILPQCQTTRASGPSRFPQWNEPLFLGDAMRLNEVKGFCKEHLRGYDSRQDELFFVLVSVYDRFEFSSDRGLGSCVFSIYPGQSVECNLSLLEVERFMETSIQPSIHLRAFLNLPPIPHLGLFTNDERVIDGAIERSFRDLSDSDSEADEDGDFIRSGSAFLPSMASASSPMLVAPAGRSTSGDLIEQISMLSSANDVQSKKTASFAPAMPSGTTGPSVPPRTHSRFCTSAGFEFSDCNQWKPTTHSK